MYLIQNYNLRENLLELSHHIHIHTYLYIHICMEIARGREGKRENIKFAEHCFGLVYSAYTKGH